MAIYYWHNQGRLGNLLFQYAAIEHLTNIDDVIVCFDNDVFKIIHVKRNFIRIPNVGILGRLLNLIFNNLIDFLVKFRVFSGVSPEVVSVFGEYKDESREVFKSIGFFHRLIQIKGFFQHDEWVISDLEIKKNILCNAKEKLDLISPSVCRVSVHIRLTDYKDWVVLGKEDATISISWYVDAMKLMAERLDNPVFIFFTDDIKAVMGLNFDTAPIFFNGNNAIEDMAAMSICEHAIISPSTFAYCGVLAFNELDKIVIAPKYWAGFKSKLWSPSSIKTKLIHYLEVNYEE